MNETGAYVRHRLKVGGCDRPLFKPSSLKVIFELTQGYPRLINIVCDHCLLSAFVKDLFDVGPTIVKAAAADMMHPGQLNQRCTRPTENQPSLADTPRADPPPLTATKTPSEADTQKTEPSPPAWHRTPAAFLSRTVLQKPAYLLALGFLIAALVWFGFRDDPSFRRPRSAPSSSAVMQDNASPAVEATQSSGSNDAIPDAPQGELPPAGHSDGNLPSDTLRLQEPSPSTEHIRPVKPTAEHDLNRPAAQSPFNDSARHNRSRLAPLEVSLPIRTATATSEKRAINNQERPRSIPNLEKMAEPGEPVATTDILDHASRLSAIPLIGEPDAPPMPTDKAGATGRVDAEVTSVPPATAPIALGPANKNRPDQAAISDSTDEAPMVPSRKSPMDIPSDEPHAGQLQLQNTESDPRNIIDFVIKKRTR